MEIFVAGVVAGLCEIERNVAVGLGRAWAGKECFKLVVSAIFDTAPFSLVVAKGLIATQTRTIFGYARIPTPPIVVFLASIHALSVVREE